MSRTERLLDLLQLMRRHRAPVTGPAIAQELGVSLRTVYRDIATLQGQGADIEGEPGLGYVMRPGFTLPPLMFSTDELEALIVGSAWVARHKDDVRLSAAAGNALSKIAAVLPAELRDQLDAASLVVNARSAPAAQVDPGILRDAIRKEQKLRIAYRDDSGRDSERVIWPFVIAFFEERKVVGAWCELRADFRHFRVDRIVSAAATGERSPRRRATLVREWRSAIEAESAAYRRSAAAGN
jgi:predicted DNA-binding transcriptional regulator YafY